MKHRIQQDRNAPEELFDLTPSPVHSANMAVISISPLQKQVMLFQYLSGDFRPLFYLWLIGAYSCSFCAPIDSGLLMGSDENTNVTPLYQNSSGQSRNGQSL
uniref:Uncharacterized protein n=1 Tax=Micrurus corallinus TaxID=54390 RepID=A0A2D4FWW8_MICCO